jgi:hypothetical protein
MDHGSQDWPSFAAVEVDPWRVESVLAAAGTLVSHADGAANRRRRCEPATPTHTAKLGVE